MADATTTNGGTLSQLPALRWLSGVREDYERVFVNEWSPYLGAIMLVIVVSALMVSGFFWDVFGGLKLWGDYFNNFIGLGPLLGIKTELQSPLMHHISLMDINLVIGAFTAALLSGQFKVSRPPNLEFVSGAFGGSLMGIGAALAGGCTAGGFFTPLLFSSPAGWAMWAGLLAGAFTGLKALLWSMENITWGTQAPERGPESPIRRFFPLFGIGVIALVLWWATSWFQSENERLVARGIIILAGFGIGFVMHRSRFCIARVFREPFMTGEGTMTKAMILALAIGIPIGSLLVQHKTVDPFLAIPAGFWFGSALGGLIFGFGMVFAGGDSAGSLWRMGEGHLKLWVAVFFFGWVGSIFSAIGGKTGFLTRDVNPELVEFTKVGKQVFLPDLFGGWGWISGLSFIMLLIWYLLVRYNESTEKFTVL